MCGRGAKGLWSGSRNHALQCSAQIFAGKGGLATVFGKVEVHRLDYGAEGADSLHPLDGELNLPRERYSHGLRRLAAEEVVKGSYDEAVATLTRYTGSAVPKRQVEEL